MITRNLRNACVSLVVVITLILFASNAFPWGSATHAYIADNIGKTFPLRNLNEIYGAMAADIFNFYPEASVPGTAYYYLYLQTHYNSLPLWSQAQASTDFGKALAFGFASHANGQFSSSYAGADYTAHGPTGNDPGYYVIDKAKDLWSVLKPILESRGIYLDDAQGEAISHNIIEFAIDIMVAYEIPDAGGISRKVVESALLRSPEFPLLLVKTYAAGLTKRPFRMSYLKAADLIISAERDFRKTMVVYGQALAQQTEGDSIQYAASLLAQLGNEVYGIAVDPTLVAEAIIAAQTLCRGDYAAAIEGTIEYVLDQMAGAGIAY